MRFKTLHTLSFIAVLIVQTAAYSKQPSLEEFLSEDTYSTETDYNYSRGFDSYSSVYDIRPELIIKTKDGKVLDLNYYPEYDDYKKPEYLAPEDYEGRFKSINLTDENGNRKEYFVPFDMRQSDFIKLAVGAGLVVMAFQGDDEIREFAQSNKTEVTENIAKVGEMIGNGGYSAPAAGAAYALGVVIKNDKIKRVALITLKAELMTGIMAQALKMSFHRERPNVAVDSTQFHGMDFTTTEHRSFPSGHTTTAFTLATIVADTYKDNKFIPVLAYGAAAVAGASRIHDNAHWASDVIAGAFLGHVATKIILRNAENRRTGIKRGFTITPEYRADGYFGLKFQLKF